jgi:hypothetical protein
MLSRLLRQRDAPAYLGMSEPTFNRIVRPHVTVIYEGLAIFYGRVDLDTWNEKFKAANRKPGKSLSCKKHHDKTQHRSKPCKPIRAS